jgi:murein DD-endopeptidase MepM/ murein hydrolase activator NlpD
VEAGQILGYTNGINHLHFGIHPGYELAENPWSGYTHNESETYGWVDPVQFLLNNTPRAILEFPSFVILPLFMLATLLAMIIYKKARARFVLS